MPATSEHEDQAAVCRLKLARDDLKILLQASKSLENILEKAEKMMHLIERSLTTTMKGVALIPSNGQQGPRLVHQPGRNPPRSPSSIHSVVSNPSRARLWCSPPSYHGRYHRPRTKSQTVQLALPIPATYVDRLHVLVKYVDSIDRLKDTISSIMKEGETTIQNLQEAVEFLSRTKATDQFRSHWLREMLVTLKALYETEVDKMRFDRLLDEALLQLQDEFEGMLHRLKHMNIMAAVKHDGEVVPENGDEDQYRMAICEMKTAKEKRDDSISDDEVEVLRRISEALAARQADYA